MRQLAKAMTEKDGEVALEKCSYITRILSNGIDRILESYVHVKYSLSESAQHTAILNHTVHVVEVLSIIV